MAEPQRKAKHRDTKWIERPDRHEDYPGQPLETRNHEVVRKWADERGAAPAAAPASGHEDRPRVLGFNFPGYGGEQLQEISWEEWFRRFDDRDLNFIYQEHRDDGLQSNFFQLDNPQR